MKSNLHMFALITKTIKKRINVIILSSITFNENCFETVLSIENKANFVFVYSSIAYKIFQE